MEREEKESSMTFKRFWELKTPNPFASGGEEQMFKCTKCGAETFPDAGWDGEPKPHLCSPGCDCGDYKVGTSRLFSENLEKIDWSGYPVKVKEVRKKGEKTVMVF